MVSWTSTSRMATNGLWSFSVTEIVLVNIVVASLACTVGWARNPTNSMTIFVPLFSMNRSRPANATCVNVRNPQLSSFAIEFFFNRKRHFARSGVGTTALFHVRGIRSIPLDLYRTTYLLVLCTWLRVKFLVKTQSDQFWRSGRWGDIGEAFFAGEVSCSAFGRELLRRSSLGSFQTVSTFVMKCKMCRKGWHQGKLKRHLSWLDVEELESLSCSSSYALGRKRRRETHNLFWLNQQRRTKLTTAVFDNSHFWVSTYQNWMRSICGKIKGVVVDYGYFMLDGPNEIHRQVAQWYVLRLLYIEGIQNPCWRSSNDNKH